MTTPAFNGNEQVFDRLNLLIRGSTDPSAASYNSRFANFLQAINSSEEMRAATQRFQASGGFFENNSALTESPSTYDNRLFYDRGRNVIGLADDFFVRFSSNQGIDGITTQRLQLAETIRVVGHELSHAVRALEVNSQYAAAWATLQNTNKTAADLSAFVNQRISIGLLDEGKAYIENWNRLVNAGFSTIEIKSALSQAEYDSLSGHADPVTRQIDVNSNSARQAAIAYVKPQQPSGSSANYVAYYALSEINRNIVENGYLTPGMVLAIDGLSAVELLKAGFRGEIRLADQSLPGAIFEIRAGRLSNSPVTNDAPVDYSVTWKRGDITVETRRSYSADPANAGEWLMTNSVVIQRNGALLYVPNISDLKTFDGRPLLSSQDLADLSRGESSVLDRITSHDSGVFVASRDADASLHYSTSTGQQVTVQPYNVTPGVAGAGITGTAAAVASIDGLSGTELAQQQAMSMTLAKLPADTLIRTGEDGTIYLIDGNDTVVGTVRSTEDGVEVLIDNIVTLVASDGSRQTISATENQVFTLHYDSNGSLSFETIRYSDGSSVTTTSTTNSSTNSVVTDSSNQIVSQTHTYYHPDGSLATTSYPDGSSQIVGTTIYSIGETRTLTTDTKFYDGLGHIASHNNISVVRNNDGRELHKLEVVYNSQGGITLTRLSELQPDLSVKTVERGATGIALKTIRLQRFDDGDEKSFLEEITDHLTGVVTLRSTVGTGVNAQSREIVLVTAADGWNNLDPAVKTQKINDSLYGGVADFLNAARGGDKVGMLLAGGKMALAYSRRDGLEAPGQLDTFLGGVTSFVGVLGALQGLKSDNLKTQIGSAVSLLSNANGLYASFNGGVGFITNTASLRLLGQIGAVLTIANLANLGDMLDNGQYGSAGATLAGAYSALGTLGGGTAASVGVEASGGFFGIVPFEPMTMAIIFVAALVIDDMFADEEPPPPPPFGEAVFKRLADGSLGYEIVNAGNGGVEVLTAKMDALLAKLNQQVGQANNGNTDPDMALALIASRMPTVRIQSWPSHFENGISNFFFVLESIHPQTGEKMYSGIARQDIVEHYAESLVGPEAIVSQWQINHLVAKFGANDANWKTEGQWLSALSPVEQQRHALQQSLAGANAVLEAAKQSSLAAGAWVADGSVTGNVAQAAAASQAAIDAAQASFAAATAALHAFESQNPADPQLAAHIVDSSITDPAQRAAAIEGAARQWLKVIAIDLGDDGITKIALPHVVKQDYDSLQNDGVARFDAARALALAALNDRPGGSISPFCEPATVTSTPHSSCR